MDTRPIEIARFNEVIAIVRSEFPHLRIDVAENHPHVEALVEIPSQPGLDFDVCINLQNCDEFHLNAGEHFWVEWFPCNDPEVFQRYVEAVRGVLSGRFRIVEFFVFGRAIKAQLQRPSENGAWETIATWGNLGSLIPWKRERRIVTNEAARTGAPAA